MLCSLDNHVQLLEDEAVAAMNVWSEHWRICPPEPYSGKFWDRPLMCSTGGTRLQSRQPHPSPASYCAAGLALWEEWQRRERILIEATHAIYGP